MRNLIFLCIVLSCTVPMPAGAEHPILTAQAKEKSDTKSGAGKPAAQEDIFKMAPKTAKPGKGDKDAATAVSREFEKPKKDAPAINGNKHGTNATPVWANWQTTNNKNIDIRYWFENNPAFPMYHWQLRNKTPKKVRVTYSYNLEPKEPRINAKTDIPASGFSDMLEDIGMDFEVKPEVKVEKLN